MSSAEAEPFYFAASTALFYTVPKAFTPCRENRSREGTSPVTYRNLGSLRDGNETWCRLPCSLLRSAGLLAQSEDSEFMPPKQRII